MLAGVIYQSSAVVPFGERELDELEQFAATHNAVHGISGYLFFERGKFIQYFEGEQADVDQLLENIRRDTRHEIGLVFFDHDLEERRFPTWQMKHITADQLIPLEHLLAQHLEWLGTLPPRFQSGKPVWRMVDRLSQLQYRMAAVN
jgi:hypothetical protein